MEMEQRGEQSISLSMSRIAEMATSAVTNRKKKVVKSSETERKERMDTSSLMEQMYVFSYDSLFASKPMEIIVETSYYQTVYPVEKHEVGSFVGKFCKNNGISLPIPFEAATVIMNVQSLERKEMSDDEAIIKMVDANIQREEIFPSERAFSFKMKMDAIKRQGARDDLTSGTEFQK
jgi:hypothetical protein